ncbi:hypothetical protein [Paenibacillus sp. FSL E2-0178]|uniref:hypothetical protein n=1 Tax=Paenibacillus sp. FSL E2-0178 TaxID=2921361 RepID=UPI003158340F
MAVTVYVLYFNESQYVDSLDLSSRECSVIDDPKNAEHFSKSEASFYAERLGCSYKAIEIEEQEDISE